MSFSQRVKEEIAKIIPETRHCALAELAAIFTSSGFFYPAEGRTVTGIRTENVLVAKTGFSLIKSFLSPLLYPFFLFSIFYSFFA